MPESPENPQAFDFEPTALPALDDPYPVFAQLRESAPVTRTRSGFWCVTGYDAVLEVLRSPAFISSPIAMRYLAELPPGAARDEMVHRINFLDPPDHPRVRGLVAKAFTPRRIDGLRRFTEATARRLLSELTGSGSSDELDLLPAFSHQVPSLVISELLGVPVADRDQLTSWSDAVAPLLAIETAADERAHALDAATEMARYMGDLADERREHPGGDLLSAMLAAEEDGEKLTRPELLSLTNTLYSAGHRTTRDLFSNGLSVLLRSPEWLGNVHADPSLVPAVVQEFLRYETPTLFVARFPSEPVRVAGVDLGPYEPTLIMLAAANRDPNTFDDPERFNPARYVGAREERAPMPLSFAFGAHFCLGASLAQMEAEIMLATLLEVWPDIAIAEHPLSWRHRGPFRGLESLRVRPQG